MTWGISLSGKLEFVKKELGAAATEIDTALDALDEVTAESVSINIAGSAYESVTGEKGHGASFSITEIAPPVPPASVEPVVE